MRTRLLIMGLLIGLFLGTTAWGAEPSTVLLSFPSGTRLAPGSEFTAWVTVSSETTVNAFDIVLSYSPELELIGFNTAGSIASLWQEGPRVRPDRVVELVGGMANGFEGNNGRLVGIEFRAVAEGDPTFRFDRISFYEADGRGTERAGNAEGPNEISVVVGAPLVALASLPEDLTGPTLDATVTRTHDRITLLAFNAYDEDSGIAATLVRTRTWFVWSNWQPSSNPVLILRSVWSAELLSVNGAGLETTQTVYVWDALIRALALALALFLGLRSTRVVYNRMK